MTRISAILTAAGEGTRMGRSKPLLSWQGSTLVEYQVSSLLEAGVIEVVVVLGHHYEQVTPLLNNRDVIYIVNSNYLMGRTTSIKAGLRCADPTATDLLLLAVDQPRPPSIVKEIIRSHISENALITSPRYRGRGGHPLVFSSRLRTELATITEETQGVRRVFRTYREDVNEVEMDDPVLRLDLNTPEEYEAAVASY